MPITRPNVNLYSINNLALDYDPGRGAVWIKPGMPQSGRLYPVPGKKIFRWPIRRSWA